MRPVLLRQGSENAEIGARQPDATEGNTLRSGGKGQAHEVHGFSAIPGVDARSEVRRSLPMKATMAWPCATLAASARRRSGNPEI